MLVLRALGIRAGMARPETAQQRREAKGMPWVMLVLSWVLHQMPRTGDRCSFVLLPIVFRALGGVRS